MTTVAESWVPRRRLCVEDYYRMAEVGLLAPDERVELIEGEIINMAPIGSPHAGTVDVLCKILSRAVGDSAIVGVQRPLRLDQRNEPQPDLILLRPRADFYRNAHPSAADALLVIEVAESSLRYDREIKIPLYARYGVPEAWLVDIEQRSLNIFRAAAAGAYTEVVAMPRPVLVTISALAPLAVDLSGVLDF